MHHILQYKFNKQKNINLRFQIASINLTNCTQKLQKLDIAINLLPIFS